MENKTVILVDNAHALAMLVDMFADMACDRQNITEMLRKARRPEDLGLAVFGGKSQGDVADFFVRMEGLAGSLLETHTNADWVLVGGHDSEEPCQPTDDPPPLKFWSGTVLSEAEARDYLHNAYRQVLAEITRKSLGAEGIVVPAIDTVDLSQFFRLPRIAPPEDYLVATGEDTYVNSLGSWQLAMTREEI